MNIKRPPVGQVLLFFPFLVSLLFGAAIAGVGPIHVTPACTRPPIQKGACLSQQGHWVCYKE